jgi:glucose-1-phosphate cytidylyltransferase
MKVVILAGGLGTRLSEETEVKPKPMVEIGGEPIIFHIMKYYYSFGFNEFIICTGYKGHQIKHFFSEYYSNNIDSTINLRNGSQKILSNRALDWNVSIVDTGQNTMTGGRILRIRELIGEDENFCVTYGDGLCDVNINKTIDFHNSHKGLATLVGVRPTSRFGHLMLDNSKVKSFNEKPKDQQDFINGGYFVLHKDVFNYLTSDETIFEQEPLFNLAKDNQLHCYKHNGFWQCMDTLREKKYLNELFASGNAPWVKNINA